VNLGKYRSKQQVAVIEELEDDGRNKLPIRITVEKVCPTFSDEGKERVGRCRVEVRVAKGKGSISLLAEEVGNLIDMLQRVRGSAEKQAQVITTAQVCVERRRAK